MLLCASLFLLPASAPAQSQVGRDEQASLNIIYKYLKLSPVTLDKPILGPGQTIKATAAFVSSASKEMEVPELSKGFSGGGHIIGTMAWYVKRLDKPVATKKGASTFGDRSGLTFVARMSKIVPGANTQLESLNEPGTHPLAHTLDLKRLALLSGEYELTLVFTGVTKFTLTSATRFKVDNPSQVAASSGQGRANDGDNGTDQAGKDFYALFTYGKIEIASEKVRLGLPFTAMCKMTAGTTTPVNIPANIGKNYRAIGTGTVIGIADYYFLRKGETKPFHLGFTSIESKLPGQIMPGETFDCLLDVNADKFKLLPGPYELILEIRGLPLSSKGQYFAYKDRKPVTLTK
jgi:hypothetical protein